MQRASVLRGAAVAQEGRAGCMAAEVRSLRAAGAALGVQAAGALAAGAALRGCLAKALAGARESEGELVASAGPSCFSGAA